MERITDFVKWIKDNVDYEDYTELYILYDALRNLHAEMPFEIQATGRHREGFEIHLLTSATKESMLIISSELMRKQMMQHIERVYMDDMDADSYFDMMRLIESED